jgi:hydrocephalus-inducing protein
VVLHNPSSTPWQLHPSVQHEAWAGPEYLDVPAGGRAEYVVRYRPLAMTGKEQPHQGTLFFPIPDGTGGSARAPAAPDGAA